MKLRNDFTATELVPFESTAWAPSPERTVERKMLERDGAEVARATSIVRYAPYSAFPEHTHELGEEFLVLTGIFADERGSYPAGTYVRNPPGSRHRPFSTEGCVIFVKLRQFALLDARQCVLRLDTESPTRPGQAPTLLHQFGTERVWLVRLAEGERMALDGSDQGAEIFVLGGGVSVAAQECGVWSWLRTPRATAQLHSSNGCVFWLKQGHLPLSAEAERDAEGLAGLRRER
jgi:hypothetical protein